MYWTILKYEFQYWLKQPSIYVYAFFLCLLPMLQMAEWAGVFAEEVNTNELVQIANSPIGIFAVFNKFMLFILFLLPTLFGRSLVRDYQQNVHALLYSFPIAKKDFLLAKFSIAFLLSLLIIGFVGLGAFLGANFPTYQPDLVVDFNSIAYSQIYFIYLIPNVLLVGSMVFAVILMTRNIYAGFIVILLLYFFQIGLSSMLEKGVLLAILDPFGQYATTYYTDNWTLVKRNQQLLPVENLLIYNRIFWLGITALILGGVYRKFEFWQAPRYDDIPKFGISNSSQPIQTIKENFHKVINVNLSKVAYNYSLKQQLKTIWQLSIFDLKHILKGGLFFSILIAGIALVIFKQAEINPSYGQATLPMTWKMLDFPMHNASITIIILTFLYAGLLVQRSKTANMQILVDSTPIPNWVLMLSKFLALIKMQALLLLLVFIGGIIVQIGSGFYQIEIGHYLFELFGLQWITFIIWALVALFVQTLFTNAYLSFFMLLLGWMGTAHLHLIGLDHNVFKYNWGPNFHYSDMTGYATSLPLYLAYKCYWLFFGLFLLLGTYCWWNRGVNFSFIERFKKAIQQLKSGVGYAMLFVLVTFVSLGSFLWYEDQVLIKGWTKERKKRIEEKMETKFTIFNNLSQPKIKSVNLNIALQPKDHDFHVNGVHTLVNETEKAIDTLIIFSFLGNQASYHFGQSTQLLLKDTALVIQDFPILFEVHQLSLKLNPKDSLFCAFEIKNPPNTLLRRRSPVVTNGTVLQWQVIPRIGWWKNKGMASPYDSLAAQYMHENFDSDWIDLETVISTAKNQIAVAPGDLTEQWTIDDRAYFRYKTPQKTPLYGAFFSADYTIKKEQSQGVELTVYHHPKHDFNTQEMLRGMKAALAYNTEYLGEYPLKQAKIVESPSIYGYGGSAFAGTMVVYEHAGFISKADTSDGVGANMPFFIAAHEFSHQWWKLQLNPAATKGADMLLEALCNYTVIQCFKREFGKAKTLAFLQKERNWYLNGHNHTQHAEPSLLMAENQSYLNYAKGSLAFYTLSEYIGEEKLNSAIKKFYDKYRLQTAPFPTAADLIKEIRTVTPDSLQYLITDLFEKVTFYDNQLVTTKIKQLAEDKYEVDGQFLISKYYLQANQEKGFENEVGQTTSFQLSDNEEIIESLPLNDFVEIGVFDENKKELYLQKHKITQINNQLKIILKQRPIKVAIDPYFKLLERNLEDNRSSGS